VSRKRRAERLAKEVEARHRRIRLLLEQGHGVAEVCKEVGLTPKRVYAVARHWNLPTNPRIWPGSDDESSIARLSASGWTADRIGRMFNQSPGAVEMIRARVRLSPVLEASARRFGLEEGVPDPGGLKGEAPPPPSRTPRRPR